MQAYCLSSKILIMFSNRVGSKSKFKFVFQLLKKSIERIHKSMVDKEMGQDCHSTFEKLKMKLNERTGYYSLLIFLFNPYSIALCASKVRDNPSPKVIELMQ